MMFKSNLVGGIIGIVLVCVFLGVLIGWVKAIPIVTIVLITIGLMISDFVTTMRKLRKESQ